MVEHEGENMLTAVFDVH